MAPKVKGKENEGKRPAVKIQSNDAQLSKSSKRQRVAIGKAKLEKASPEKESTVRRSLRTKGLAPAHVDGVCETLRVATWEKVSPRVSGPLSMTDAHDGTGSHENLVATLLSIEGPIKEEKSVRGQLDLGSMKLESKNVAMVVPNWVMTVKFMPCSSMRMVVAGDKVGNVGFWNMDSEEGNDGRCLYRPHSGPISGILFRESCISQMFTSCYNGYVRMMDLEKGEFILVRKGVERLNCLTKPPNDDKSLYMGEGRGVLTVWDTKSGKPSSQLDLHSHLINTIDFNPGNSKIMATGARDKTAKIWDLRFIRKGLPRCLKEVKHKDAVNSAYFSPSGAALATLSLDNYVGIQNGTNWDVNCMIPHVHGHSVRYIPKLRAIWGWDDSCILVGSMEKAIDVISPVQRGVVMSLDSPNMGTVPCRFDAHPQRVGLLAGAAAGGKVYVWTCS